MSQCMGSGEEDLKRHSLMYGYLTLAPNQIDKPPFHQSIVSTSRKGGGNMTREYVRSNMQCSLLWCCPLQEEWDELTLLSTRGLQQCWQKKRCSLCSDLKLDSVPTRFCTFESLYYVYQGGEIILTPPNHWVSNWPPTCRRQPKLSCSHGHIISSFFPFCHHLLYTIIHVSSYFCTLLLFLMYLKMSEKTPQFFSPSLPAEYVTAFSGRTDAPEVRCDLTDKQTDRQTQLQ